MLAIDTNASADPPRFRVIRITPLNSPDFPPAQAFDADVRLYGSMGINNCGEVVYGWKFGAENPEIETDTMHPWVWLPVPAYGFDAGFHDLFDVEDADNPGNPLAVTGIARDINDSGIIAGQARTGRYYTADDFACTWKLFDETAFFDSLGTLRTDILDWSGAEAINNDDPPIIVGQVTRDGVCLGGCLDDHEGNVTAVENAFQIEFEDTLTSSNLLGPSRYNSAVAHGVSSSVFTSPLWIAGDSVCQSARNECYGFFPPVCSEAVREATRWPDGVIMDVVTEDSLNAASSARGVSDSGHVAGWSINGEGENPDCVRIAEYWPAPDGRKVDLSQYVSDHPAWAEGVNNWEFPMVVGWDEEEFAGVLWEQDQNGWTATYLNDVIDCSARWAILYAHDVNDDGWIAVIMHDLEDNEKLYAGVLVPYTECLGELTCDGIVDTDDLLILINAWGECPDPPDPCPADLNENGVVDVDDLLILLNNWGRCPAGEMEMFSGGGSSELTAEDVLEYLKSVGVPQQTIDAVEDLVKN
jgi:uncharacterized membrane protein